MTAQSECNLRDNELDYNENCHIVWKYRGTWTRARSVGQTW